MDIKGKVSQIETFGLADGPGVRFIIFLQGCNMRCKYCHNPETWSFERKVEEYSADELIQKELRYKSYQKSNGGITISGGEPLCQIEFVTELLKKAKEHDIHTAIDTSLQPFSMSDEFLGKFDRLLEVTDLFLVDIKAMDKDTHKALTGHSNENILTGAKYLSDKGKAMWIRRVLVPGITDGDDDLKALRDFISSLKTVERTEILPYHTLGVSKWQSLNIEYPLKDVLPPTDEEVKKAEKLLFD